MKPSYLELLASMILTIEYIRQVMMIPIAIYPKILFKVSTQRAMHTKKQAMRP